MIASLSATLASAPFPAAFGVIVLYLMVVAALLLRVEFLQTAGRLAAGTLTYFSPLGANMPLVNRRRVRTGRLFRLAFGAQHKDIGDGLTTALVFAARTLLALAVIAFVLAASAPSRP